jgi:hypothetical protein
MVILTAILFIALLFVVESTFIATACFLIKGEKHPLTIILWGIVQTSCAFMSFSLVSFGIAEWIHHGDIGDGWVLAAAPVCVPFGLYALVDGVCRLWSPRSYQRQQVRLAPTGRENLGSIPS